MGRKNKINSIILDVFTKTNAKTYKCKFCDQCYVLNVTRMSQNLVQKCMHCPPAIKQAIIKNSKAQGMKMKKELYIFKKRENTKKTEISDTDSNEEQENDSDYDADQVEETSDSEHHVQKSSRSTVSTRTCASVSTLDSFVHSILPSEEEHIWELLARACYATNTPLSITSLKLPSRHQLSNKLLNSEYDRVKKSVNEKIHTAKTVGIQIDGWSNISNESIVNVLLTTPEPVLYKIIDTKAARHEAIFMCNIISEVIDEIDLEKIMSITTDNARNMRASWNLLAEKYPNSMFSCYGCAAHILNLLVHDILKIKTFDSIAVKNKLIIKTIKKTYILNATFSSIQKKNSTNKSEIKTLKLPVTTRWGSICTSLNSLLFNKRNLQELSISENVINEISDIKLNILNDDFWGKIELLYEILSPLAKNITEIQTSKPIISRVADIFNNLHLHFSQLLNIKEFDRNELLKLLANRKAMAVGPLHFVANLLDPYFMGKNLNELEYIDALTFINKMSTFITNENELATVMMKIAIYKSKEGLFAKDFVWTSLKNGKLSAVTWWKSIGSTTKLSKVAVEVLNCPPSTAATERSFSTYGNIHTNKINRLTNERAQKIVYVRQNLNIAKYSSGSLQSSLQSESEYESDWSEVHSETELDKIVDSADSEISFSPAHEMQM